METKGSKKKWLEVILVEIWGHAEYTDEIIMVMATWCKDEECEKENINGSSNTREDEGLR